MISPRLANIYLHAFDRICTLSIGPGLSTASATSFVMHADDFVMLYSSREQADDAERRALAVLGGLGLSLHPDKTRVVDLREGHEGFDLLGSHFRGRMCGRLWLRWVQTRLQFP